MTKPDAVSVASPADTVIVTGPMPNNDDCFTVIDSPAGSSSITSSVCWPCKIIHPPVKSIDQSISVKVSVPVFVITALYFLKVALPSLR